MVRLAIVLSLLSTAFLPTSAFSGTNATTVKCPLPHPDYDRVLGELETLKRSIRNNSQGSCDALVKEVDHLEEFYSTKSRAVFRFLTSGSAVPVPTGAPEGTKAQLQPAEIDAILAYSRELAKKSESLVSATLMSKSACLNDGQKLSTVGLVASILQQASSVSAQYTGPYGLATSMGGAAIAGAMRAIDGAISKLGKGRFNNREFHDLYVRSLCVFSNVRQELNHLLDPEIHLPLFERLHANLEQKKQLLASSPACPNCDLIWQMVEKDRDLRQRLNGLKYTYMSEYQSAKGAARMSDPNPWNTCTHIANLVHRPGSVFTAVREELFQAQESLNDGRVCPIFDNFKSLSAQMLKQIPKPSECFATKDMSAMSQGNLRSSAFLDLWCSSAENFYMDKALVESETLRNNRSLSEDERNFGDWMMMTFHKLYWTKSEITRFQNINEYSNASAQVRLAEQKMYLDRRFYDDLATSFLDWYREKIKHGTEATTQGLKGIQSRLATTTDLNIAIESRAKEITKLGAETVALDYRQFEDFVTQIELLRRSTLATRQYCAFFKSAGAYYPSVHERCSHAALTLADKQLQAQAPLLQAIRLYFEMAHQAKLVAADSVMSMIQKIDDCFKEVMASTERRGARRE